MNASRARYDFGDFTLDVGRQRLLRRGTGEAIPLTAKVFDTLACLVENAGQPLTKEELLRSIWPGVIVEENSLTQNISTLRQVLGEVRGENRYIVTIPRKGYRFVAEVTSHDDTPVAELPETVPPPLPAPAPAPESAPARERRRMGLVGAGAGVLLVLIAALTWFFIPADSPTARAPAPGQTLAILPFKPLASGERNESLELGMTESLIEDLGQRSPGAISPLSSVRRYAALNQDPIAAGRELGVDIVLDGWLQRRGNRLRASVRLLRVADARQLWAQSFDQDFATIFEMQDAIAAGVAQAVSVGRVENKAVRGAPYTRNPEAYALYAGGRLAWTRQTEQSLLQAIDFFEQAIALDPDYALAYSGLADSYAVLGVFGIRPPHEVFPKARRSVDRALSIDPDLAAAHSALGHIKVQYEHDWEGAAREYALAMQLDPVLALTHHRRGLLYVMQGEIKRAVAASEQAQQIEPLWLAPRAAAAHFLYYERRYDASIRGLEQVLAIDERVDNVRGSLIRSLIAIGDYERAIKEYDKYPIRAPGSNAFRAQALALSGRRADALAELNGVLARSKERYVAAYDIALIYAALADPENAFLWLERALEDRSTLINFMALDPMLDALHGDARFASLVRRTGIYQRVLPDTATVKSP